VFGGTTEKAAVSMSRPKGAKSKDVGGGRDKRRRETVAVIIDVILVGSGVAVAANRSVAVMWKSFRRPT
jgi:hypothetical protein